MDTKGRLSLKAFQLITEERHTELDYHHLAISNKISDCNNDLQELLVLHGEK